MWVLEGRPGEKIYRAFLTGGAVFSAGEGMVAVILVWCVCVCVWVSVNGWWMYVREVKLLSCEVVM